MWRGCRVLLRRPGRGRGRVSPKFLSALPAPQVHRAWHRLGDMSEEEKREVTHGAWRSVAPVQLVPDTNSRPEALSTATAGSTAAVASVTAADVPLAFASDEAADAYLREEDEDDRQESTVPTLRLAQGFFSELAAMADAEIDREMVDLQVPQPKSDEERRQEEWDAHRQFFGDYYTLQGLVPQPNGADGDEGAREAARYAFIDAMLTPARALFQVNAEKVLSRLTVRDQLERDPSGVFRASGDALVFQMELVPTQHFGERPRLPYAAETRLVAQRERAEAALEAGGTALIESAEALSMLLNEEGDNVGAAAEESPERTAQLLPPSPSPPPASTPATVQRARPPSVGHLHWLQRLVAADVLANVNVLSPLLSLLATRLAATTRVAVGQRRPRVIFDPFGHGQTPQQSTTYSRDIAQRAWEMAETEEYEGHRDCCAAAEAVVVVVALPAPTASDRAHTGKKPRARNANGCGGGVDSEDFLPVTASSRIPVADRGVNVVYVQPRAAHRHHSSSSPSPSSSSLGGSTPSWPHCRQLLGRCDVVLCAPRTSEDGVRPRVILGDDEALSTSTTPSADAALAVPNRFLAICSGVNDHYHRLKAQLIMSLRHARRHGGWVLYATQSMNPVENEAVVCAVLTEMRRQRAAGADGAWEVACVPLTADCVGEAFPADELVALRGWLAGGSVGGGRRTWSALEGGPADQDVTFHDPALVGSVAAASWRSTPVRDGSDGCYLCLLRVQSAANEEIEEEEDVTAQWDVRHAVTDGLTLIPSMVSTHTPASDATDGLVSLATSAAAAVHHLMQAAHATPSAAAASAGRGTHGSVWRAVCAGLPAGEAAAPVAREEKESPFPLRLSAALSGTAALAQWVRSTAAVPLPADVAPVSLSALMLSELLLQQQEGGGGLRDGPLHRRLRALHQRDSVDEAAEVERQEVTALLDLVARLRKEAGAKAFRRTLLLSPCIPAYLATADAALAGDSVRVRLHEAVAAELANLHVVAQLDVEEGPVRSRHGRDPRFPFRFSLTLPSLSPRSPDRPTHDAAIAELSVGIRDALLYVLRRIGCPVDRLGLVGRHRRGGNEEQDEDHEMGMDSESLPASQARIHTPDEQTIVELAEDEYTVEASASMLSPGERHRAERQLRRMEKSLRVEGGVTPDGRPAADDWERTVPAAYRQRWRQQSQRTS